MKKIKKSDGGLKKITQILKKYELSQLEISKILKISPQAVNFWFVGRTKVIKQIYFDKLAKKGYL